MRTPILLASFVVCAVPLGLAGQGAAGCHQIGSVRFGVWSTGA